jgi:glucose/arabinose dehydrogenase
VTSPPIFTKSNFYKIIIRFSRIHHAISGVTAICLLVACNSHAGLAYTRQILTVGGEDWVLQVPEGMRLEVLTTALKAPRLMHFMPNGDLIVGSKSGNIYRLAPPYREPNILVKLSGYPHSVTWRDGKILVAQTDGIYQAPYHPGQQHLEWGDFEILVNLPEGGGHNSRSVAIGPDGRVYVSLGISSNCSDEYLGESYPFDKRRGGVMVLDEGGEQPRLRPFASGLRNPVGFDWHPETGELYASNNGPDHQGFELPPEYFSKLEAGSFHGMPWFQYDGKALRRDSCIRREPPRPRQAVSLPVATLPSRNAPMGVAFVPSGALDTRFEGNAIVALRGSWGTRPTGGPAGDPASRRPPRLMMVHFQNGAAVGVEEVLGGLQREDGRRLMRPVGTAIGPDGALYFTSDSNLEGLFRLTPVRQ